jgi:hypothetical protein
LKAVVTVPSFDTGEYEGSDFAMSEGDARLTIRAASIPPFSIQFKRVRWHQYTAKYNCTADQVEGCYFSLVEVAPSRALQSFLNHDKASAKAYKALHHFRIFLDEEGCHELFAESASANNSSESDALQATRVARGAQG